MLKELKVLFLVLLVSYVTYILDLTYQVYKQSLDNSLFDYLIQALVKINDNFNPLIISNILELKYLNFLGVMPNLDECNICGNKNIVTLSCIKGGFLCDKCRNNEVLMSSKALKLIRLYYYVDISKIYLKYTKNIQDCKQT